MPRVTLGDPPILLPSTPSHQEENAQTDGAAVPFAPARLGYDFANKRTRAHHVTSAPFNLLHEMDVNRNAYAEPKPRTEGVQIKVKLTSWASRALKEVAEQVHTGPFGKPPGIQPMGAACIVHCLPLVADWSETRAFIDVLRRSTNKHQIGLDVDGSILEHLDVLLKIRLPKAPVIEDPVQRNISLDQETGRKLMTLAKEMAIPYNGYGLGSLIIMSALALQPVDSYSLDPREEMEDYLIRVRRLYRGNAYCATAIMDKLQAPHALGEWNGRRE
jgi:hypothetical protein